MREAAQVCLTYRGRPGVIRVWEKTWISDDPPLPHVTFLPLDELDQETRGMVDQRFLSLKWDFAEEFIATYVPALQDPTARVMQVLLLGQPWSMILDS